MESSANAASRGQEEHTSPHFTRAEGAVGTFDRSRPAWHVRTEVADNLGRDTSLQGRSHVAALKD